MEQSQWDGWWLKCTTWTCDCSGRSKKQTSERNHLEQVTHWGKKKKNLSLVQNMVKRSRISTQMQF